MDDTKDNQLFEVEDKTDTMPGSTEGAQYVVLFTCGHFKVGARVCEGVYTHRQDGHTAVAIRVRIQTDGPTFTPATNLPPPFRPRSPLHASATLPGPALAPAITGALAWCLLQREEVVALTASAIAPPGISPDALAGKPVN